MTSDLNRVHILFADLMPNVDMTVYDENEGDSDSFDDADCLNEISVFHMRSHHSKREGSSFERKRSTDRLRCQVLNISLSYTNLTSHHQHFINPSLKVNPQRKS